MRKTNMTTRQLLAVLSGADDATAAAWKRPRSVASKSGSHNSNNNNSNSINKNHSSSEVIDLTADDSDDDDNRKCLADVSNKNSVNVSKSKTTLRKKESKSPSSPSNVNYDSEVEVLQDMEESFQPAVSATLVGESNHHAAAETDNNDDEVIFVGTKHHVDLPHMRQHCTRHPFCDYKQNNYKDFLDKNQSHCRLCYCYVCDVLVADCPTWPTHCVATNAGLAGYYWKAQREKMRVGLAVNNMR